ncbi:Crp/Fnr family transcriptional regulator [Pelistega suis]|uniref:Crp/Fnr family transcriptional regulator n=1 Tax=Pelistega suis TaxID=1631957 RepID=A0A849PB56_9BURK|nr:Crp/Fnr family transcriptional regulator [Pelistega suis]NOL52127.1 Crp/Fnr family transcriptional regulator [Pelistega suis]
MIKINLTSIEEEQLRSVLAQHPVFGGHPAELYASLLENAGTCQMKAGDRLFSEGDVATQYFVMGSGAVEMFRYSIEGDERVFSIFERGEFIAHAAMFMPHGKYPMNARARDNVKLYVLDRQALHKTCHRFPVLAIRLLSGMSMNIYKQINQVHWLTSSSAHERLAHYFVLLQQEQKNATVIIPVTQKQLAAQLGIRAETLNRILGEWQQKDYIRGKRKEWELLDIDYLNSLSGAAKRTF